MKQRFTNNFSTTVAATFGSGDGFLQLTSTAGFPTLGVDEYIKLTVYKQVGVVESSHEVIKITGLVGNQATVSARGMEGGTPTNFVAGDRVQCRITALSLEDLVDVDELAAAIAGLVTTSAMNTALSSKANTADVYAKAQTYTQAEVNAAITVAINNLVNGAPGALDQLNELAAALGNDANFATTVTNALAAKVNTADLNKAAVGLSAVDNTSDADKPLSTAAVAALANKVSTSGGAITGQLSVTEASTGSGQGVTAGAASSGGNAGYAWATNNTARWVMDTTGGADSELIRIRKLGTGAGTVAYFASNGIGLGRGPGYQFDVLTALTGTAATNNTVANFESGATGRDVNIRFSDGVNSPKRVGFLAGALYFASGSTENARFSPGGRLLINKTTDDNTNQLQVSGTINASGNVTSDTQFRRTAANTSAGYLVNQLDGSSANNGVYWSGATNLLQLVNGSNAVMSVTPGQNVLVGSATDDGVNKVQVTGSIQATGGVTAKDSKLTSSGATTIQAIYQSATVTASGGVAYGILSRGTLTAAANADSLNAVASNTGTVASGAFTGLSFSVMYADGASWVKTGTGTVTTAHGLYASAPTIGTTNWAAYFSGNTNTTGSAQAATSRVNTSATLLASTEKVSVAAGTDIIGVAVTGASTTAGIVTTKNTDSTASTDQPHWLMQDSAGNVRGKVGTNYTSTGMFIDGGPGGINLKCSGATVVAVTSTGADVTGTLTTTASAGIGGSPAAGRNLSISKNITGSAVSISVLNSGAVQSDVTTAATVYSSNPTVAAAAFTLPNLAHFYAGQGTIGAGATVTAQNGFTVDSTLTGATNNYGFRGVIPSGAGRWNIYIDGTAINYLAGALLIGSNTDDGVNKLQVTGSGKITSGILTVQESGTGSATGGVIAATATAGGNAAHGWATGGTNRWVMDTNGTADAEALRIRKLGTGAATVATINTTGLGLGRTPSYQMDVLSALTGTTVGTNAIASLESGASGRDAHLRLSDGVNTAKRVGFLAGALYFATGTTEDARFSSAGNLIIGTTTDNTTDKLQVTGSTRATGIVNSDSLFQRSAANTVAGYMLRQLDGSSNGNGVYWTGSTGQLQLITGATTAMTVFSSQRVHIGTTPVDDGVNRLQVSGSAAISSTLTAAGITTSGALTVNNNATVSTTSSSAALTVTQAGTGNAFVVEDSASTDSTPFVIDAAGHVVVGHTASIPGAFSDEALIQSATVGGTAQFAGYRFSNDNGAATVYLNKSRGSSLASGVIVQSGDGVGNLAFAAHDGVAYQRAGQIQVIVDAAPAAGSMPGRILFNTTPSGSTTPLEALRIDSAQRVAIGGTAATSGTSFTVRKGITGATTGIGMVQNGAVQSDVTSGVYGIRNDISTAAASFTLGEYNHFFCSQQSIGAGSTVTNQNGFRVENTLTGATNNYGFRGQIASGSNRYNLYMDGTADNYLNGALGIGTTVSAGTAIRLSRTLTGSTSGYGILNTCTVASDVTSDVSMYRASADVASGATLTNLFGFSVSPGTYTGTVTTQMGFYVASSLTGATNNRAFQSDLNSGTNRFNLYMAGTAINYLNGALLVGSSTDNGVDKLQITGSANITGTLGLGTNLVMSASNAGFEIGSTSGANTPFIDFHSSGNNIDFDARFACSGGTGSTGQGVLTATTSKLAVTGDSIQINTAKTPASAAATGTTGQICWDANYVYVCTATNTWKRAALTTW